MSLVVSGLTSNSCEKANTYNVLVVWYQVLSTEGKARVLPLLVLGFCHKNFIFANSC